MDPWALITVLGRADLWLTTAGGLVLFYFLFRKRISFRKPLKKFLWVFVISILLVFGTVILIKNVTMIPRPCGPESLYCLNDYAFPSGHSAGIFAFFTALLVFVRRRWLPLLAIPVLVAYSRVALGVHTPADVIAGSLIGVLVTGLVWEFLRRKGNI